MNADPLGRLRTEILDDAGVAAMTTRVRGGEPMAATKAADGSVIDGGDVRGPGKYVRYIVITQLGSSRLKRSPLQEVRLLAKCYGTDRTGQDATALAGAVSDAIHARGHRTTPIGLVIFGSFDDGRAPAVRDPDTQQYHSDVVIQVGALAELLT